MRTICDLIAWLAEERASELNLTEVETASLRSLLSRPHENMPYLDRIRGVWEGHPLCLEEEAFSQLCGMLSGHFEMPELAARLRLDAYRLGGLLTREESQGRFALMQRGDASVH